MNQKGISSIVIILVVVGILVIGGGGFYFYKIQFSCVKEGGTILLPLLNTQKYLEKTKCCEGLKLITNSGLFDENCNHYLVPPPGTPSIVCTRCGDGKCGKGETECNCPEDCQTSPAKENTAILYTTVIDKITGESIENAIVYLGRVFYLGRGWDCYTNNEGKCSIKDFSLGDYGLGVFEKGYDRFTKSSHFEKGDNYLTIELEKKSETSTSFSMEGTVFERVTSVGTKSENHYYSVRDDKGNNEYVFNEIGENGGFDKFVNKRVRIRGFRETGFIGWQHEEAEGIYIEEIELI